MSENTSQADAGTTTATDGDQPQAGETQKETTTIPTAREAIETDNVDAIRALMRASSDTLLQSKRDPWTGEIEEETPAAAGPEKPAAEAPPGEEKEPEPTPEEAAAAEAEAAAAEAAKAAASEKHESKNVRLKRERFGPEVQPIIDLMAEKRTLSFEEAKAELIAAGKLPQPTESKAIAATLVKDDAAAEIAAQTTAIADLEQQIEAAGAAFDTTKLAKLNIQHHKALVALSRLEAAEPQRLQAQAQEHHRVAAATTKAETDAIKMFPDAGVKDTPLYEAIEDLIDEAEEKNPGFRGDPDWPIAFAAKAARDIGYQPPPAATAVVPKKAARTAVVPASGSATGAAATKAPTLEARMAEAEGDPDKLRALLREAGSHSLA